MLVLSYFNIRNLYNIKIIIRAKKCYVTRLDVIPVVHYERG